MRHDRALPTSTARALDISSVAIRARKAQRQTAGRSDGERHDPARGEVTRRPANGVARPGLDSQLDTTTAAVTDPAADHPRLKGWLYAERLNDSRYADPNA